MKFLLSGVNLVVTGVSLTALCPGVNLAPGVNLLVPGVNSVFDAGLVPWCKIYSIMCESRRLVCPVVSLMSGINPVCKITYYYNYVGSGARLVTW